jgi:sialate O-acetylesterase
MNLSIAGAKGQNPFSLMGRWKYKVEKAYEQPDNIPPRPAELPKADNPAFGSNIYNAMVKPVIPYAIKGAIWYQGESNAGRAEQYRTLFPAMIEDWRKQFGQGDFPFYFVQLANFGNWKPRPEQPADSGWAELREAQTMALKASKDTGMAVIIDIGDTKDIHPKNKQDVGKRLALIAENRTYGKKNVEYLGPMYSSHKVKGTTIRVKFKNAKGLESRDGAPKSFAIAGEDQKFHWAEAKIDGDEVIVSSKDVSKPVAVRYAWEDDPQVNTYNAAGLPMCPFRTDDWKMSTAGQK